MRHQARHVDPPAECQQNQLPNRRASTGPSKGEVSSAPRPIGSRSDLQQDRSVEDQFHICRSLAKREGIRVVQTFDDRALSGASLIDRKGALALIDAAKRKAFDTVIVESLDRLSRDQADLAIIYKTLQFHGVEICTVNEGVATPMHVGIRGLLGAMFLRDLGDKVRRGAMGRVREGKIPGAVAYGYEAVPGKPGERRIKPDEAKVLRFIYEQTAKGRSGRDIAAELTAKGVPAPDGGSHWSHQIFTNGQTGLVGRPLHRGEIHWNTKRTVLNPETGRKTKRFNDRKDWLIVPAEHLRIIDEPLWDAAMKVRRDRAEQLAPNGKKQRAVIPRNRFILSGMLRCAACGGSMRIAGATRSGPRMVCSRAHQRDECSNRRTYSLQALKECIADFIQQHVDEPKRLDAAMRQWQIDYAKSAKQNRAESEVIERRLSRLSNQINRLAAAVRDSDIEVPELLAQMKPLQMERAELEQRAEALARESNIVSVHPSIGAAVAERMRAMGKAILAANSDEQAKADFRAFFAYFEVHPAGPRQTYEVTPVVHETALAGA
jgi:DNA invertase Pin-like site-specific DNA recombinase